MTSLKPQLIRADTIDLQSPDSPSAKDHSKQPPNSPPLASNAAAPHQNQTLRTVEQHALQEQLGGPVGTGIDRRGNYPDEPEFFDDPGQDDFQTARLADGDFGDPSTHDGVMQYGDVEDQIDDDDDDDAFDDELLDRLSSSPSIDDDEDIDLEFVYALRTFVAKVEGQAHATKGDTMVLLDDSNSYWWLVRVLKDSSIGYLPAEHIETPRERLARLNKRRNIDLSATMLSDNAEKSKNPLKKAMRRRNAKTVQFSAPQYVEPSDVEYSDDDEEMDEDFDFAGHSMEMVDEDGFATEPDHSADMGASVMGDPQPLNTKGPVYPQSEARDAELSRPPEEEVAPVTSSMDERPEEMAPKSKRSLVRSTDSFLNDDGAETKKISLTPRLLQGDSDYGSPRQQPEPKSKSSVESLDRLASAEGDKPGEEKKKKEKKGMLGGFFKRKDKRSRSTDSEPEESKKVSGESARVVAPPSKRSSESLAQEVKPAKNDKIFQRQSSKLQKQPRPPLSLRPSSSKDNFSRTEPESVASPTSPVGPARSPEPSGGEGPAEAPRSISPDASADAASDRAASPSGRRTIFTSMTDALKPGAMPPSDQQQGTPTSPVPDESVPPPNELPAVDSPTNLAAASADTASRLPPPKLDTTVAPNGPDRLSESPIEVSPMQPWERQRSPHEPQPRALVGERSSTSDRASVSPPSSRSSVSELVVDDGLANGSTELTTDPSAQLPRADAATPSTSRSTPTWSDASLRTYMDNDEDIRDLLIIVHDKSNVAPAGPEHPITGNLFCAEKGRLADMQATLDSMLTGWLSRKSHTAVSG